MPLSGAPTRFYRYLRGQLGSVREVYGQGNSIVRRGDLGHKEETVLLLHGFMQTRAVWQVMEDRLRYDGYGVMSFDLGGLFYRFNTKPIVELAETIHNKIEGISQRYGLESFHIVGHSKGGLIARHYIQNLGGLRRVRSLTTLGSPHHGTPTALLGVALFGGGLISRSPWQMMPGSKTVRALAEDTFPGHVPFTSIYSKADLVCPHWSSKLNPRPGETSMRNIQVNGVGHTALCHDPGVYLQVRGCLQESARVWKARR
jgi:triacylglycerol esterase/lipase EstA (alpha/beta hydrolase family)